MMEEEKTEIVVDINTLEEEGIEIEPNANVKIKIINSEEIS